jgi:hypothetical protein
MVSALHRGDMQISLITKLISQTTSFAIIVALLAVLSRLEIFSDNTDLLFGVFDNIQTHKWSFPSF